MNPEATTPSAAPATAAASISTVPITDPRLEGDGGKPSLSSTLTVTVPNRGTPKRKWNEDANIALLKEVLATGAHIPPRNEVTQRFTEVAKRLNENKNLKLPWRTDGKHCRDRFRLLIDKWVTVDAAAAAASGGGESFGEYETLCTDIKEAIDSREEEIAELTKQKTERNERLVSGGEVVRELAMNRQASRSSSEVIEVDEVPERPKKTPRRSYGESQRNMSEAIEALERGEENRVKLLEASAVREEKRISIEERRLELETDARNADREVALRRIAIEERRVQSDDNRAKEAADERRMNLSIQSKMLDFLSAHIQKHDGSK